MLALLAGERGVVHAEGHGERRRLDFERRQRLGVLRIDHAVADLDIGQTNEGHDVAHLRVGHIDPAEAFEQLDLLHLARPRLAVIAAADELDLLAGLDRAAPDAPDADAADVLAVGQRLHAQLQRAVRVALGGGDVRQDRLEDRADVVALRVRIVAGPAVAAAGVEDRELELVVARIELDEEVEDLVQHRLGPAVGAVDLVDHHDRLQAQAERLAQDEPRLGHRPLGGVDEQEAAVGHREDAFDLSAEVGVAGRVDQVDLGLDAVLSPVGEGDVLRQDGDAPLAFEGVGVEDHVAAEGAFAEIAALA